MAFTWAARRQLGILFLLLVVAGLIFFAASYKIIFRAPTCSDQKQNGTETGIDCGGTCARFCSADVLPLSVLWARALPVTNSVYNAVAYVENKNPNAGAPKIEYEFRLYDADNKLVVSRSGSTYVSANGRTVVFEPSLSVGNRTPKFTIFEVKNVPLWYMENPLSRNILLSPSDIVLSDENTSPKLSAKIANQSQIPLANVEVAGLLYNADHNVIGVSRTFIPELSGNSRESVIFTWPQALSETIAAKDVVARFNPFLLPGSSF